MKSAFPPLRSARSTEEELYEAAVSQDAPSADAHGRHQDIFREPQIASYGDGLWFCFVSSTTIGYGDLAAVTFPGRLTVVIVTFAGILTTAMVPGVVVAYYTEFIRAKEKETVSTFLEKLERLPELDREELTELSERVKQYVNGNKK